VAWAAPPRGAAFSGRAQGSVQPVGAAVRTSLRRLSASRPASAYSFLRSCSQSPPIHLLNRRRTQRQPHPHLLEHHGAAPGSRGTRSRLACPRWPSTAHASRRLPSLGRSGVEQLHIPPAQIRQRLRRAGAARSRREARGRRRRRRPGYVLFLLQQRPRPSLPRPQAFPQRRRGTSSRTCSGEAPGRCRYLRYGETKVVLAG
jgi:hypothetical protein